MRSICLALMTSLRLRGALWLALLIVGLTTIACTSGLSLMPGSGVRSVDGDVAAGPGTLRIRLQSDASMRTQATNPKSIADVHHFTVKLYTWTGGLGSLVHTHSTTTATVTHVAFTNVQLGTYAVTAEAFSSPTDTASVTQGGPQISANTATISAGSPPTYSSGTSLAVALTLTNAAGDALNVAIATQDGRISSEAHMAPGDTLSPTTHHDFTVLGPNNATCAFVWVPVFDAWQLCYPPGCGSTNRFGTVDSARPQGYWVSTAPAAGTEGSAWRKVTMGGFYAGKYEASHMDAVLGGSAGTSTVASVRQGVAPWTNISWDDALQTCRNIHRKADLMGDREWLALAVWAMINNLTVEGNNNSGSDFNNGSTTFTPDGIVAGRAFTGSGPTSTSNTGSIAGIYDLNGNVAEWTRDLNKKLANSNWNIGETELNRAMPTTPQYVVGQATIGTVSDGILGLVGVPILNGGAGNPAFGNDVSSFPASGAGKCARGGHFSSTSDAGLWNVDMTRGRADSTSNAVGFRPMLQF